MVPVSPTLLVRLIADRGVIFCVSYTVLMAKILICTGIYPPAIGGPAQYAKEVADELKRRGNRVKVLTYKFERKLPPIVRHELFFWRTLFGLPGADFILALDTFSVGWPAVAAARLAGKKILIRTGGDFLWESYVERTGEPVLLRDFYRTGQTDSARLNRKEKWIFRITRWTLQNSSAVIFSTDWQREIFESAYGLMPDKNFIVENRYGGKLPAFEKKNRIFVAGARPLKWKNIECLKIAFAEAKKSDPTIELDVAGAPYERFLDKIRACYAVVLVSLGDISPNMILDALRTNTPFILTRETGLYERLKNVGIFVDPKNPEDIKEKILFLADRTNYAIAREKIEKFNFVHGWSEICDEILEIAGKKKHGDRADSAPKSIK